MIILNAYTSVLNVLIQLPDNNSGARKRNRGKRNETKGKKNMLTKAKIK
tara:strand:+ start:612 stop:758 length:147 start_codon:yes stop_codon:yes gene_type:complete